MHRLRAIIIAASLAAAGHGASAQTATGNLIVTAGVLDTCSVVVSPLTFATLSAVVVTNELTAGTITITCTSTHASTTVTLGGGENENAGQRRMTDGLGNFVNYNLFSDAGHSSSVAVDGNVYSGSVTAAVPQIIPVYGQVPAGSFAIGAYADSVLVTFNY